MNVDMSPEAITTRLKRTSQLRRLCLALGKAVPLRERLPEDLVPNDAVVLSNDPTESTSRRNSRS